MLPLLLAAAFASEPRRAQFSVDCRAPGHAISPLIYGTAKGEEGWWLSGTTARRWGGNANTRYNWELGNAWSAGKDWFFRNTGGPARAWEKWLEENARHGVASTISLPIIGWVARDNTSWSFPVSVFGEQQATEPGHPDIGNGVTKDGQLIPPAPPGRTSVPAPPEFIARWVRAIREK